MKDPFATDYTSIASYFHVCGLKVTPELLETMSRNRQHVRMTGVVGSGTATYPPDKDQRHWPQPKTSFAP